MGEVDGEVERWRTRKIPNDNEEDQDHGYYGCGGVIIDKGGNEKEYNYVCAYK